MAAGPPSELMVLVRRLLDRLGPLPHVVAIVRDPDNPDRWQAWFHRRGLSWTKAFAYRVVAVGDTREDAIVQLIEGRGVAAPHKKDPCDAPPT